MIPTITHPDPIAPLRALMRYTESMTRMADTFTAPVRAMHHMTAVTRMPVVMPSMPMIIPRMPMVIPRLLWPGVLA